ncbi:MBOAT family O-acyltransferase [Janthinobacterium rivuli]|uniref:Probable alginate O-acetylase AlgI n=1 Tax=Janthinobacterium rivuli TaxID=2751478 RepID=A0ABY8I522_9BURK|nr:MBOAT family O-acyltransferase [Janthinobacterium rivuli]WFR79303.1 MBOAT family O-acyltransferase [Janthinobacterium rivuli]
MSFTSYWFTLAFLPVSAYAYRRLISKNQLHLLLPLLISLVFYYLNDAHNLLLFCASMGANWVLAGVIAKNREKTSYLALAIAGNLCFLALYKYAKFFVVPGTAIPALPLGISYFTFTQIAFLVDTARGQARSTNPLEYALFVAWFPHLPAGPLLSHKDMLPQFMAAPGATSALRPAPRDYAVGLTLFAMGLFKKSCVSPLFLHAQSDVFLRAGQGDPIGLIETWIACLGFLFETYYDFCGYSEMAMGISRMFGIHLPVNFHAPFKSSSPVEFWTRWHVTLGAFMRDYLYRPLTKKRQVWRHYAALFVVMMAVAIWHGATVPLLIFGIYQGLLVTGNHALRRWNIVSRKGGWLQHWAGRALTLAAIGFSVSLWATRDWHQASSIMLGLLGAGNGSVWPISFLSPILILAAIIFNWFAPSLIDLMTKELPAWSVQLKKSTTSTLAWRPSLAWAAAVAIALCLALINLSGLKEFKYAGF